MLAHTLSLVVLLISGVLAPGAFHAAILPPAIPSRAVVGVYETPGARCGCVQVRSPYPIPPDHRASLSATLATNESQSDVGLDVLFSITASGGSPPYGYAIRFGDGSATGQGGSTIAHAFPSPGDYNPIAWVNDSAGASAVATVEVTIGPLPAVSVSVDRSPALPGASVNFTARTGGGTGSLGPVEWEFGDGTNASGLSVNHTYATAADYEVIAFVRDSVDGSSETATEVIVDPLLTIDTDIASPATTDTGVWVHFETTFDGGTPPYSVGWWFSDGTQAANDTVSAYHRYYVPGTYPVDLWVNDSLGRVASEVVPMVVRAPVYLASYTESRTRGEVDVGESDLIDLQASGGVPPYTYSLPGAPPWCAPVTNQSFSCTPPNAGDVSIILRASDSGGGVSNVTVELYVAPALVASLTPAPADFSIGSHATLVPGATGGFLPYVYSYPDLSADCVPEAGGVVECGASQPGPTTVELEVRDATGGVAFSNATYLANPDPTVTSFTVSPRSVAQGSSVDLEVVASGGTAPLTYAYLGLPPGCASVSLDALACVPSASGTFALEAVVADADGATARAYANLTVAAPQSALDRDLANWGPVVVAALLGVGVLVLVVVAVRAGPPRGRAPGRSRATNAGRPKPSAGPTNPSGASAPSKPDAPSTSSGTTSLTGGTETSEKKADEGSDPSLPSP